MKEEQTLGEGVDAKEVQNKMEKFASQGKTPLLFAREGRAAGIIAVADTVRDSSREESGNSGKWAFMLSC